MSDSKYWGYEFTADVSGCDIEDITSAENITNFTNELIERIGMQKFGPMFVERFATHDPKLGGYSMSQMVTTSLVSAHFGENTGEAYFNIFSCKKFDRKVALEVIQQYFNPTSVKSKMVTRQA